jgi:hypothetical protein
MEFNSLEKGFQGPRVPGFQQKRDLLDFNALKIPPYLPLSKGGDLYLPP